MIDIKSHINYLIGYILYYTGYWIISSYTPLGLYLYRLATKYNNVKAINKLGYIYSGDDTNFNFKYYNIQNSIDLYSKGIQLNDPISMKRLAYLYENGHGVPFKLDEALTLYKKSYKLTNDFDTLNRLVFVYHFIDTNPYEKVYYNIKLSSIPTNYITAYINKYNLKWNTTLHSCWSMDMTVINNTVRTLLLISKSRKDSKYQYIHNAMIKGITMKVIKYYMELNREN
jgi:hypothetical protein